MKISGGFLGTVFVLLRKKKIKYEGFTLPMVEKSFAWTLTNAATVFILEHISTPVCSSSNQCTEAFFKTLNSLPSQTWSCNGKLRPA